MEPTVTDSVPGTTCDQCKTAVTRKLRSVAGIHVVDVDLDAELVRVTGQTLDDAAVRAALAAAGSEAA